VKDTDESKKDVLRAYLTSMLYCLFLVRMIHDFTHDFRISGITLKNWTENLTL